MPDIECTGSGSLLDSMLSTVLKKQSSDTCSRLWKFTTWRFIGRGLTVTPVLHLSGLGVTATSYRRSGILGCWREPCAHQGLHLPVPPHHCPNLDQSEILNGCIIIAYPCSYCWKFSVFPLQCSYGISSIVFNIHAHESLGFFFLAGGNVFIEFLLSLKLLMGY